MVDGILAAKCLYTGNVVEASFRRASRARCERAAPCARRRSGMKSLWQVL
jgi:hypothetical protein